MDLSKIETEVPHLPPENGYTFDPEVPILKETLPPYVDPETKTIKIVIADDVIALQKEDENLQGYYLVASKIKINGYFGPALIKYFNNRGNEITRQAREYYEQNGVTDQAMTAVNMASTAKNKRELEFVGRLDHPNIVKILAYISPSGTYEEINAIVMEGESDGPLDIYLTRNKPIQLSVVILYAFQLASALAYCHEKGIIHRDIRPRNIYVFDKGTTLKLGNFGFARVSRDGPMTANKEEEIYYKAPEMIFAGPLANYGFPVDVYSYGMVLWTICHNGEKPFGHLPANVLRAATKFRAMLEEETNGIPTNRPAIFLNRQEPYGYHLSTIIEASWVNEKGNEFTKRPTMSQILKFLQDSFPDLPNPNFCT